MKKLLTIFMILAMPLFILAQENTKQKEVGLTFSSLDNFGFTYKVGTEKAMWRFGTMYTNGQFVTIDETKPTNTFSLGLSFGKEYRKKVAEKLEFRYGGDISMSSTFRKYNETNSSTLGLSPGINAVVGLNYIINDHLVFGAELLPGISYNYSNQKTDNNGIITSNTYNALSYNFSTNSAKLSLVYRIK